MALIQSNITSSNQATKVVSLTETTGVYGSSNLGGYGASQVPSGAREIAGILSSNIYLLQLNGTFSFNGGGAPVVANDIYSAAFDAVTAQAIANGSPILIDLSSEPVYVDGVYKAVYYNWFVGEDVVNIGPATNQIAWSGDPALFTNAAFIKLYYGESPATITYEILSVDVTNSLITVNGIVPQDMVDVEYEIGYTSNSYFQNVHNINTCLHSDIAKSACSDCGCSETKKNKLFLATMDFFGIQPNMDRKNYKCAKEIIDSITIYCSKSGCGC